MRQASLRHCLWVELALSPQQLPTPRQTLARIIDSQSALQQASPYSACIIAYASSFSYNFGILCYTTSANSLRILNFNSLRGTEKVFDSSVFNDQIGITTVAGEDTVDVQAIRSIQIQSYAAGIVVLVCDSGPFGQYIVAVNIADKRSTLPLWSGDARHPRVRLCMPIRSSSKLFVRNNGRFMVVGSHSATDDHNHHEWLLDVYSLETGEAVTAQPLQLRDFHGSEIGSTACFTIHDDEFYAITSQTSYESEEVDWTSYYHVVQFRLDDPNPELTIQLIWRRQHLEGPINDAWNDLGFQIDHSTGELLVVEGRKEWLNGGSRSIRTYYTQPIPRAEFKDRKSGLRHPPDENRLSRTLDEHSNSRWEEPMVRVDRYVHAEFQADDAGGQRAAAREYIRARTKWNGYSFNAQAFIDLVTDEAVMEGEWRPHQRIKLRVVSRHELSPLVRDNNTNTTIGGSVALVLRKRTRNREGQEIEDGERAFTPSCVSIWPPDDAPQGLHEILCPEGRAGDVKAMLGDEGIVYMAGPPREPGSSERALVFISFDPTFGFQGMQRLDGSPAIPRSEEKKRKIGKYCEHDETRQHSATLGRGRQRQSEGQGLRIDVDRLADPTKRLKLEALVKPDGGDSTSPPPGSDEQELSVLPQTAQALGLATAPLVDITKDWPPSLPSHAQSRSTVQPQRSRSLLPVTAPSTGPRVPPPRSSPSGPTSGWSSPTSKSIPSPDPTQQTGHQGHGKGKAPAPPKGRQTWREKAMYTSIGSGYWLR
ncbi:uncharacterized protein Z520_09581 [Fonsecaea multimorphosa CBS 102226]|uniref:F-box domain-containing protein n=1 Tax=Fonsecaea multimorphosa CBS 102226 TaxID=1442371 RepID=A0A0D2GYA0_9EURO|nr:uncharacterized protein Z520_09581 [Fonsecaea multimorphosa CBS 102226]KIX94535.1 hypothetical protein Z520_09581 [Fonsecaea multimorphosa CBS 102226]OAL20249.1 hypothetical protein AYO22_08961 [Fonsecaea multimorphosa]